MGIPPPVDPSCATRALSEFCDISPAAPNAVTIAGPQSSEPDAVFQS